jgi:cytochrome c biogenesis protein CcmG/thiol:disulfide interchange protein DsbE
VILGLNSEQAHEGALEFARKNLTYPVILDARPVFERYGVRGIPTTFVIDREGRITLRHVGFDPGQEKELEAEARRLLGL